MIDSQAIHNKIVHNMTETLDSTDNLILTHIIHTTMEEKVIPLP
jgi:hypothetical protein